MRIVEISFLPWCVVESDQKHFLNIDSFSVKLYKGTTRASQKAARGMTRDSLSSD